MDQSKLRAWWFQRQGLDGSLMGKPSAEILEKAGWSRSVGGVGPYLTLFARGRIRREEVDAAIAELHIHELPSARGCTYVKEVVDRMEAYTRSDLGDARSFSLDSPKSRIPRINALRQAGSGL